jgi:diguanylate cyclase (GGDEF)-like protein
MDLNTAQRLDAVIRTRLLDTPSEERFDRITRIAAFLQDSAVATFSLVDGEREWFKSCFGVQLDALPLDSQLSFAPMVLAEGDLVIFRDTITDPKLAQHRMVAGPPYVRFYAGHPVFSPDGQIVGVLSLMDSRPHRNITKLKLAMRDLSALLGNEIYFTGVDADVRNRLQLEFDALSQRALSDPLTGLWNRGAILDALVRELARAYRRKTPLAVMLIDVDQFKSINDRFGHAVGDDVLLATGGVLRELVRNYDSIGRYGGDELLLVLPDCAADSALAMGQRYCKAIAALPLKDSQGAPFAISASIGIAVGGADRLVSPADIIATADQALYRAKHHGRNRAEIASCDADSLLQTPDVPDRQQAIGY